MKEITAWPSRSSSVRYTRVPRWAYLQMLFIRLSNTRHSRRPSARMVTAVSGCRVTRSRPASFSFCSYSPAAWVSSTPGWQGARFTSRFPVEALDASTRSSISRFSRSDWRVRTAAYSGIFSLFGGSFPMRSA